LTLVGPFAHKKQVTCSNTPQREGEKVGGPHGAKARGEKKRSTVTGANKQPLKRMTSRRPETRTKARSV